MQVQYVFGPNAGKTTHLRLDSITDLLIKAGVLEVISNEPVVQNAPKAARFVVAQLPQSGEWFVKATDGRTDLFYSGAPADLPEYKFALAGGVVAPEEICREYARVYTTAYALDNQLESQAETLRLQGQREKQR